MSQSEQIKIYLIGDYFIFRVGLQMLIETQEKFAVIEEAAHFSEVSDTILENKPDVVLLNESEVDDETFVEFMKDHSEDVKVIIFSESVGKKMFKKAFKVGARGLISKKVSTEILFRAIEQVHNGQYWFDRRLMGETMRQLLNDQNNENGKAKEHPDSTLTDREWDVLTQVCKGLKNRAIAENLYISETTVKHHVTSIFEKFNVKTRLELVVFAFQNRLVEVPPKVEENSLT